MRVHYRPLRDMRRPDEAVPNVDYIRFRDATSVKHVLIPTDEVLTVNECDDFLQHVFPPGWLTRPRLSGPRPVLLRVLSQSPMDHEKRRSIAGEY